MLEIEQLAGLVSSENAEKAASLVAQINKNISASDDAVNKQESAKIDAIKSRDSAKSRYKDILGQLGLTTDEASDEKVSEIFKSLKSSGKGDEKALEIRDKEIQGLKDEVAKGIVSLESERQASKGVLLDTVLERDIATVLPKYNAKANATPYISQNIKQQAQYEDGRLIFKNNDGTTLRIAGKDASLEDVIKDMQEKERENKESMFFNIEPQRSGAGTASGGLAVEGDYVP